MWFRKKTNPTIQPILTVPPKTLEFDGSGPAEVFLDEYAALCKINHWTEEEACRNLASYLKGTASQMLQLLRQRNAAIQRTEASLALVSWSDIENEIRTTFNPNDIVQVETQISELEYNEAEHTELFYYTLMTLLFKLEPLMPDSIKQAYYFQKIPMTPGYNILMGRPASCDEILIGLQLHFRYHEIRELQKARAIPSSPPDTGTLTHPHNRHKKRHPTFPRCVSKNGVLMCYNCMANDHTVKNCRNQNKKI